MLISIVVPVYRSNQSLLELAERVAKTFEELQDFEYELILVNDSPDEVSTANALNTLLEHNDHVVVIELTRNFGQQAATLCGIERARGEYVVTMDDDLQHSPEDIPILLSAADHDAVIARFLQKKHSLLKRITSELKSYFDYWILKKPKSLKLTPFRLLKSSIAKKMNQRNTPFPFIPALLFEITHDVVNVDIDHFPRAFGNSSYSVLKMVSLFSHLLINNSSILLRIAGVIGIVSAIIAFMSAGVIIVRKITLDIPVSGWASVMTTLLFFGGAVLLTLGIIGEYLIRIIATSENRRMYHVRSVRTSSQ